MKARNLLLALGCAAAFTACTVNDEPAVAPAKAMRTVTLNVDVDEPADTRVAYTEKGDVYKFAWTSTDELKVLYKTSEGSSGESTFSIDKIKANGKQATFTGELPDDAEEVLIVYSSKTMHKFPHSLGFEVVFHGTTVTDDDTVASALAENTFLYAFAAVESSGTLPNVKLEHGLSYLLLESGLKMINNVTGVSLSSFPSFQVTANFSHIYIYPDRISSIPLDDFFEMEFDNNGCLTSDYLIPFMPEPDNMELAFSIITDYVEDYYRMVGEASQPPYTYQPGVVYKVAADNTKWEPIEVWKEYREGLDGAAID